MAVKTQTYYCITKTEKRSILPCDLKKLVITHFLRHKANNIQKLQSTNKDILIV